MANELGERLAEIREHAGLSQSALARLVDTSQSAISQIEAGERNPSYEMLRRIADALKVTAGYLLGGEVEDLNPEEEAVFRLYRGLPAKGKSELQEFAAYLRTKYPPRPNKT